MNRSLLAPVGALVLVQVAFASLAVAGRYVLAGDEGRPGVPPLALAAVRVFFASLLLAALAMIPRPERVAGRDVMRLAGLAFLGVAANQILFLEGVARSNAVNASVLIATIPVFTLVAAVVLRHERFNRLRLAGVLVALVGTLTMLRPERFRFGDDVALGNAFIVLNCLSYSFYLVLARPLLQRYRSLTIVAWTFLWAALPMVPLGAPDLIETADRTVYTDTVLWAVAWIILIPSVLSYALNNYALKLLHASTVGSFVFLQPAIGVFLSVTLLEGETLGWRPLVAGVLILAGVLLVVRTEPAAARGVETAKPISPE